MLPLQQTDIYIATQKRNVNDQLPVDQYMTDSYEARDLLAQI